MCASRLRQSRSTPAARSNHRCQRQVTSPCTPARHRPHSLIYVQFEGGLLGLFLLSPTQQSDHQEKSVQLQRNPLPGQRGDALKKIINDDDDGDYDDDDGDDDDGTQNNKNKNDGNEDFLPTTSAAESPTIDLDNDNPVLQEMIKKHRSVFMSRAFPPTLAGGTNLTTDIQLWCRPQEELDYIVFVLSNWQPNINLKTMEPGPEREHLTSSRRNIT